MHILEVCDIHFDADLYFFFDHLSVYCSLIISKESWTKLRSFTYVYSVRQKNSLIMEIGFLIAHVEKPVIMKTISPTKNSLVDG